MPTEPSRTPEWLHAARRIIAVVALAYGATVLALCFADGRAALEEWPYVPLSTTGDDMLAVLEAAGRNASTDTAMIGLAARAASPPTGPAAVVIPVNDNALHEPGFREGRKIPWNHKRLLDDLLVRKVEQARYTTAIEPDLVDTLLESGDLEQFSAAVLAPPAASIGAQERLTVYRLSRDDRFVLLSDTIVTEYLEARP